MRPLHEQSVVITGASSGIGRRTAIEFAKRGAQVTLAARNDSALKEVASEIRRDGGKAHVVVTDVAEWPQVERLAEAAAAHYGRIDTWVNNAGVSVYAHFEDLLVEEIDRIIRVDLLGQIYGAKAALPYMRKQGEGTIINVASELGVRGAPLQSIYCAAKHGVKGFTEALRLELDHENSGVRTTLILPGATNTPFFAHSRSKLGAKASPPGIVYEPEAVAEAIVFAAEHPRRDIFVGVSAKSYDWLQRLSPAMADQMSLMAGASIEKQKSHEPDNGRDTLFEPWTGHGAERGDYPGRTSSWYTKVFEHHPALKVAALGAVAGTFAAGLLGLARRNGNGHETGNGWRLRG
ncbi:SDR family oxidoreductase [Paludisphaera borealis]|uniref:Putative oxidoreductase n=1 Tax=Paludisphaera borealis TaxID=1387353 RepID=A0A1U7CSL8_9BACT|nr:SDR family oxidoreductase [Paludisphaera borealis]APW61940.1 putative oxidoreductase [Paludisphaera borealis]